MTEEVSEFLNTLGPDTRIALKKKLREVKRRPHKVVDAKLLMGWKLPTYQIWVEDISIIYTVGGPVKIVDIDDRRHATATS